MANKALRASPTREILWFCESSRLLEREVISGQQPTSRAWRTSRQDVNTGLGNCWSHRPRSVQVGPGWWMSCPVPSAAPTRRVPAGLCPASGPSLCAAARAAPPAAPPSTAAAPFPHGQGHLEMVPATATPARSDLGAAAHRGAGRPQQGECSRGGSQTPRRSRVPSNQICVQDDEHREAWKGREEQN